MLDRQLQRALDGRRQKGTLRNLTVFETTSTASSSASSSSSSSSSSPLVDLSSNDYLSLSTCPQVRNDFIQLVQDSPLPKMGSTGSRLLDGNSTDHEELEHMLSAHFESNSSLLFNSGYDANVSIFSTLPQPSDVILYDELVHASVHDGMRKARVPAANRVAFAHNSAWHLREILGGLRLSEEQNVFLSVESVYSMDGDVCPLVELLGVVESFVPPERLCVVVDEAHSTGVYGRGGRGLCHALGVSSRIRIRLMTFGKAMGSSGAVILCEPLVRHYLINYARPLIFSTSLSHVSLLSMRASMAALQDGRADVRAARLLTKTRSTIAALARLQRPGVFTLPPHVDACTDTPSPIVPLLTPHARSLAAHLRDHGLLARSICYPTVPKGADRVRICIHADNDDADLTRLAECLAAWIEQAQLERGTQSTATAPAAVTSAVAAAASAKL